MKVQVLVAAMNQHDHTLVEKMNIWYNYKKTNKVLKKEIKTIYEI